MKVLGKSFSPAVEVFYVVAVDVLSFKVLSGRCKDNYSHTGRCACRFTFGDKMGSGKPLSELLLTQPELSELCR